MIDRQKWKNPRSSEKSSNWYVAVCDCHVMQSSEKDKYLGIVVNKHLRWNFHINSLVISLRNSMYILYKLRHVVTKNLMLTIYKALFQSLLQYGVVGWGAVNKTHINALVVMQKNILKVMFNKPRRFPSDLIFEISRVLDVRQIYLKAVLVHIYKKIHIYKLRNALPDSLYNTRRGTQDRSYDVIIPRRNKLIGIRHVDYIGMKIYNQIDSNIRDLPNVHLFKKSVTSWILSYGRELYDNFI